MEDSTGFSKRPRAARPQAVVQVVDNSSGSRTGGKAGGHKTGVKAAAGAVKPVAIRVVSGRAKKASPDVTDHISRQLKALYDGVSKQPVPPRFIDLLSKLDEGSDR